VSFRRLSLIPTASFTSRFSRRTLNARRIALDSRESTLRNDEAEFAQHVQYFEQRLGELHLLGAKVQKQSAEVAEQYAKIAHERALIEAARAEARQFIELGEKAKADQANLSEQFRAERQSHEKERAELQAEKTKILLQKEIARKHLQMSKVLAGVQSGLGAGHYPPSAGLEASPLAYSKTDSFHPTASPSGMYSTRVMHSSPAHDLHGLGSGFTGFSPSPSSAATFGAHEYDFYPTAESPVHYPPASHHGDMSAALEALSSHAENLKGFLAEENIMVQESP
jgi:hypothetical protein